MVMVQDLSTKGCILSYKKEEWISVNQQWETRSTERETETERERTTQGGRQQRYAISMGRVTINDGGRGAWRQQGNSSNGDS
jgi:DNA-binding transcriptional regulator/RsmH inhibitor MraZ